MSIFLSLLIVSILLELILYSRINWLRIRPLVGLIILITLLTIPSVMFANIGFWAGVVVFLSFYRLVNLVRIYYYRSHIFRLYNSGRNSSILICLLLLVSVILNSLSNRLVVDINIWLYIIALVQLIAAITIFVVTKKNVTGLIAKNTSQKRLLKDLPSLTVAIPARNETTDLEKCLDSLLLSDYPKLEILVLDDSSQNRRTPEIIKSYAHAGVRFLAGKEPPERWLPKNYAYDQLVKASSGEYILFCGVDTRFSRYTISEIINQILDKKVDMLGLVPKNLPQTNNSKRLFANIYQPSRYSWELSLPRKITDRPPVLSTSWIIKKDSLNAAGGFDAVSQTVSPERYLATYSANKLNGYSFEASNNKMDLSSEKTLEEQYSTALRTRYPSLHRKPELVALTTLAEFVVLIGPVLLMLAGLVTQTWLIAVVSAASAVLISISYNSVITLTYRKFNPAGLFTAPLAAAWDLYILNKSMVAYEFGNVYWKGRNITVPVMRIYGKST